MGAKNEVVEQALKLIAEMGGSTSGGIRAYHGTPYKFDKFEWSPRVYGTGEGAQAFGHGLYFAGNEQIAKHYREKLAFKNLRDKFRSELPDDAGFDDVEEVLGTGLFAPDQERILTALRANDWLGFDYPSQAISALRKDAANFDPTPELTDAMSNFGHMYEVNIDADPNRLLDWMSPLSKQSADVRAAMMPFSEDVATKTNAARKAALDKGKDFMGRPYGPGKLKLLNTVESPEDFTGQDLYKALQRHYGAVEPGQKAVEATKHIIDSGLHGIKFPDASSRSLDIAVPEHNYVIPEDKRISILRRYEEGGRVEKGGGGLVDDALAMLAKYFEPEALAQADGFVPKSRERVTYMSPDEFLQLARPLDNGPDARKLEALRKSLDAGDRLRELPYLGFTHDGDVAQITGHEGRHRAMALKERGVDRMPVAVKSDIIRWSEQADPSKYDYVKNWPKTLKSEIGDTEVPFPFVRPEKGGGGLLDDAMKIAGRALEGGGDEAATMAARGAEDAAGGLPAHLREGYKVEAAPGAASDVSSMVDYLNSRGHLPFDNASRMQRKADMDFTYDAYHGAPRDIEGFNNRYSSPEGYWGGHHYATTSPVDASENYASRNGSDLVQRMSGVKEQMLDNFHPDDVRQWYEGKYGDASGIDPMDSKLVNEWSDDAAAEALGLTNHGAVYPVSMRMKNPVRIDSPNQTFWQHIIEQNDDGDIMGESGPAIDLINATRDVLAEYGYHDSGADEIIGKLIERSVDYGGLDAKTYSDVMRGEAISGFDPGTGDYVSPGHIMSDVFQRIGHDGIDMPTDVFAPQRGRIGMAGTGGDTRHYIVFDPKNIRSRFGAYDPFKADSTRLSDARGGRVAKGGGGALVDEAMKLIRAYHGSPHDFEKFEWSPRVRGTGEGAQAYGDGLYFAGNEKVARSYRESLAGPSSMGDVSYKGVPVIEGGKPSLGWKDLTLTLPNGIHPRDLAADVLRYGNVADTIRAHRDFAAGALNRAGRMANPQLREMAERQAQHYNLMADVIEQNPSAFDFKVPGHMYEVDLRTHPGELLDWDKQLRDQPEAIKRLMPSLDEARARDADMDRLSIEVLNNKGDAEARAAWDAAYNDPANRRARIVISDTNPKLRGLGAKGEDIYRALAPTAPDASQKLLDAGVPGLRFLDGMSRVAGEGTHNYTIFDPDIIDIRRKYEEGGRVEKGGGGSLVDEAMKIIRAYHVSPHDFDKFEWSPKTRSTGEGAQAFGDGLYFAENPKVSGRGGEYWQKFNSSSNMRLGPYDRHAADTLRAFNWDRDKAVNRLRELSQNYANEAAVAASEDAKRRALFSADGNRLAADLLEAGHHVGPHTYEVDIKADPRSMLRWDEPMINQPKGVYDAFGFNNAADIEALRKEREMLAMEIKAKGWGVPDRHDYKGEFWRGIDSLGHRPDRPEQYDALRRIDEELAKAGNQIPYLNGGQFYMGRGSKGDTSMRLLDHGVPGVQYWDGMSRSKQPYIAKFRSGKDLPWASAGHSTEQGAKEYLDQVMGYDLSAPAVGDYAYIQKNPKATSNYVIFDDKLIDIKDKYEAGGRVAKAGGGGSGVEAALAYLKKAFGNLPDRAVDDAFRLTGADLVRKSRNLESGVPVLGNERYGKPLREMLAEYDQIRPLKDYAARRPHDLVRENAVLYPALGDGSMAGRRLTKVGETPLTSPTDLHGGFEFSRDVFGQGDEPAAWASRRGAATTMADRIASRTEEGEVPYLTSVMMGPKAVDSTHMMADPIIKMIPGSKIARGDLAKFDAEMRKEYPEWPGIAKTDKALEFMNARGRPGTDLSAFVKKLDKKEYRAVGFPDAGEVRFSVSEPRLLGSPQGASGFSLMKVEPTTETMTGGAQHGTYTNKIKSPEGYSGGFENIVPLRVMFPEWFEKLHPNAKVDPTKAQQSLLTQFPKQRATNEWADNIEQYWEENPMPWGYAEGGEVDDDISGALRIAKGGGGELTRLVTKLLGPAEREGLAPLTRPGSGYLSVPGKPGKVNMPRIGEVEAKPIPRIMDAAEAYMASRGKPGGHAMDAFPELDIEKARRIAKAFARMPHAPDDPAVRRAYEAMADETLDQFNAAKDLGIDFKAIRGDDPYASSPAIGYADIAERGNLHFFPTDAGFGSSIEFDPSKNPLLKRIGRVGDLDNATVNDAFRIVHDLYGHYGPGNPFFRGPGEERAYLLHRQMYSPDALPAMTTETRGQNSWLNYGPHEAHNSKALSADTIFADQKTGIMAPWTYKADGGAISDALRIAKAGGGSMGATQPAIVDANGVNYDVSGNVIQPERDDPAVAPGMQHINGQLTPYANDPSFMARERLMADNPGDPTARILATSLTDDTIANMFDYQDRQDAAQRYIDSGRFDPKVVAMIRDYDQFREATGMPVQPYREPDTSQGEITSRPTTISEDVRTALPQGMAQDAYDRVVSPIGQAVNFATGLGDYADANYRFAQTGETPSWEERAIMVANMAPAAALAAAKPVWNGAKAAWNAIPKSVKVGAAGLGAATMGSDEAVAGPERWFSKAVEVAKAIPMEKMSGEQALAMLRKNVSPEELRWTGAEKLLKDAKSINKGALVDYLEKNRVKTRDVTLGAGPKPTRREDVVPDEEIKAQFRQRIDDAYRDAVQKTQKYREAKKNLEDEGRGKGNVSGDYDAFRKAQEEYYASGTLLTKLDNELIDAQIAKMGGLGRAAKYADYATPGGTGYHEVLTTTNMTEPPKVEQRDGVWTFVGPDGEVMKTSNGGPYVYQNQQSAEAAARVLHGRSGQYRSPHWEDPDVLFHTRGQILDVTPEGANRPYKAYNSDETQSDLAQAGRKEGFINPEGEARRSAIQDEMYNIRQQYDLKSKELSDAHKQRISGYVNARLDNDELLKAQWKRGEITLGDMHRLSDDFESKIHEEMKPLLEQYRVEQQQTLHPMLTRINELQDEVKSIKVGRMPVMPYVGSTDAWTDLSIKKSIDRALDSGADYFTWTPGEEQVKRFDLSKHVDSVEYDPQLNELRAYDPDGEQVIDGTEATLEELDQYIGKELADKIRAKVEKMPINRITGRPSGTASLVGEDMKVGGEGMRKYYNDIYVKRVQKVLQQATGKKPKIETITVQTANGPRQQLGVRLDEDVQGARFSDFSSGGHVSPMTGGKKAAKGDAIGASGGVVERALALTAED